MQGFAVCATFGEAWTICVVGHYRIAYRNVEGMHSHLHAASWYAAWTLTQGRKLAVLDARPLLLVPSTARH